MSNNTNRPQTPVADASMSAAAQLQQRNPEMYARIQKMRPELLESANEHLLKTVLDVANTRPQGHGHAHNHSSSCSHAHSAPHFSQPFPEPPPKPPSAEMDIVQAVQYNELERVRELVETAGNNVNTPDREGCYLLHWAAINDHVEIARYLIAKGAEIDVKGGDLKATPLHWACRQGCLETFFLLVDNGASIDSTDVNGIQPIHIAAQHGQIKILAYLLGSGVEVDCRDGRNFTPLIYSCLGPPTDYVPLPNSTHVCCTQFLLTFGADLNYQEPTRYYTPLHFAINNKNPISFHVLLKSPQINIQLKNSDNCDALMFARTRNNVDAIETLQGRIKSSKLHIKPVFLQRFFTNAFVRKWLTRFFILFAMSLFGLSVNASTYSMWLRILFPIVVIFLSAHVFSYFAFDTQMKDNFAYSYVLSSTLLMYVTFIIYLQDVPWTLSMFGYHLCTIYGLYCVLCLKKTNPGFLRNQTMIIDGNTLTREKVCVTFARDPRWTLEHFCVTCLIRRPLRSKHCPMDSTCVAKFDHHCTWLDACIGGRNYFYFLRILTCGFSALLIWMYYAVTMIFEDVGQFTWKYMFFDVYDAWFTYILILTMFNIFWVGMMTTFHWFNSIYLGVTLNERLTGFRYGYFRDPNTNKFHNPFRNQICRNFLESFGLFRLMALCRYPRVDWSQIYDINQIGGTKNN